MESEFSIVGVQPDEAASHFDEKYAHILHDFLFTECIVDNAAADRVLEQLKDIFIDGSSGVKAVFRLPAEEATDQAVKEMEPLRKMAKELCDQIGELLWNAQLNALIPMAQLLAEQDAKIHKRTLN